VAVKVSTGPSVSSGVSKGWNNVLLIVTAGLEVVVTAVPVLVLLLIGWFVWRLRRRHVAPTPAQVTA
jgi:heme/copper-type cytochrome/quinol oxidase subunit 2